MKHPALLRTVVCLIGLWLTACLSLCPRLSYAFDTTVTPDAVLMGAGLTNTAPVLKSTHWMPLADDTRSFGRPGMPLWIRASIVPPDDHHYILEIPYPHLRQVRVMWVADGEILHDSLGGYGSRQPVDLPCRGLCFEMPQSQGRAMTLFVGVESDSPVLVPLHLYDLSSHHWHTRSIHVLLGIFYGTFLSMFFYHLFLYVSTGSKEYLFYDLYIASIGLWCSSHDGTLRDFLFGRTGWFSHYDFHYVLTLATLVAGALFTRDFLNTRYQLPRVDAALKIMIAIALIGSVSIIVRGDNPVPSLVSLLTLGLGVIAIGAAYLELRQGIQMARYFMVAWIFLVTGSLLWVMTLNGILPYGEISPFFVHLGGFFETILLSLAMGDRINYLQAERARLQKISKTQLEDANLQLAASNRFKDDFLSIITHELRTPMNGVVGAAELLKMTSLKSDQADYLDTVLLSSEHMLKLIDDLLTCTQLSAGRCSVARKPFKIRDIVRTEIEHTRAGLKGKDVLVDLIIEPTVPESVIGDQAKTRMFIQHLLDNAAKFTVYGKIRAHLGLSKSSVNDASRQWLEFIVIDTGCGIEASLQERIFDVFRQADGSMSRSQGGLGIGLSLSRQIITLMGGRLQLTSEPGVGTTVKVDFPVFLTTDD